MTPQHTLSIAYGETRTVVALAGEIDTANADEVAEAVREELSAGPVLFDLSQVSFIDSSGLRMLAELVRDAQETGWSLSIGSDLAPMLRRLLELTGMLEMLPLDGDGEQSRSN
jgi:anti-anti-sigma factor